MSNNINAIGLIIVAFGLGIALGLHIKTERPIITTYGEKKCHLEDISKEVRDANCRTEFNCVFP